MTSGGDTGKRERERAWAARLLVCTGADPRDWKLLSRDQPDLVAKSPSGRVYGLEITQLLPSDDGRARAVEVSLTRAIHDTVFEFIRSKGGRGGTVFGTNLELPPPSGSFEQLRQKLLTHLELFGSGFDVDGAEISEPFKHGWGSIQSISRDDSNDDVFLYDSGFHRLPHKEWKSQSELEDLVIKRVSAKVVCARGYDLAHPLWLGIRNINDVMAGCSKEGMDRIRAVNSGMFHRITVFHDPWDTLDARPIEPRFVDVLP